MGKIQMIKLKASSFHKMHNLIFLKIYKSGMRKFSMLNIHGVLDYLPKELRFLSWEECPLPYVPLHFCAENLIKLEMRNSKIRQLYTGNQHFPNLEILDLSYSKDLNALPDLSHAPKIKRMDLRGCVSLAQIHSSIFLREFDNLIVEYGGPAQIKVGASMKGTSSGLVVGYNYLDVQNMLWEKVRMKLLVCGNIICGVKYKHVAMPLEEEEELGKGTQSLRSLLPFLKQVCWIESPIEFGDDFKQHYTYVCGYEVDTDYDVGVKEGRDDRGEMIDEHAVSNILMEEEEEVEEEEEWLMGYNDNGGSSSGIALIRVPNSISRWCLLGKLILEERDKIGKALSIPEASFLKSLSLPHHYSSTIIKPHFDVTLSFPPDIPTPDFTSLFIYYDLLHCRLPFSPDYRCFAIDRFDSWLMCWGHGRLWTRIERSSMNS